MTFSVWYRLSDLLINLKDHGTLLRFTPYVNQFIYALAKHCQLHDDIGPVRCLNMSGTNSIFQNELPDEKDDFFEFRNNVAEVIRDIIFIVGSVECFQYVI